jgi:hypothetical protein
MADTRPLLCLIYYLQTQSIEKTSGTMYFEPGKLPAHIRMEGWLYMRKSVAGLVVAAALLFANCVAPVPPPPPPVVVMSPRPDASAVWVPGHYKWRPWMHRYEWIPGHWKMRRGRVWVIVP